MEMQDFFKIEPLEDLRKQLADVQSTKADINSPCLNVSNLWGCRSLEFYGICSRDNAFPAIHWAVMQRYISLLLDVIHMGGDVNLVDPTTEWTPLQLSIRMIPQWCEGISILLKYHADVTRPTRNGLSIIQLALRNKCSFKTRCSVFGSLVSAGCPLDGDSFLYLLSSHPSLNYVSSLDQHVAVGHTDVVDSNEHDGILMLDFAPFISHNSDEVREVQVLQKLAATSSVEAINHPLVKIFLTLKWSCMRKYHLLLVLFYFIYILMMTGTIIMGLSEEDRYVRSPGNKTVDWFDEGGVVFPDAEEIPGVDVAGSPSHPLQLPCSTGSCFTSTFYTTIVLYVINFLYTITIFTEFHRVGAASFRSLYFYIDCAVVSLAYVVLSCYLNIVFVDVLRHFEAILLLLLWSKLMLVFGKNPMLGIYVAMFTKVARDIFRFLSVYSILILAFAMTFSVVFYDRESFQNPWIAVLKTMTMMIGEYDFDTLLVETKPSTPITVHIIFLLFLLFVSIVLLNLLIGLAVSDIQKIKDDSQTITMQLQIDLLHSIEMFFASHLLDYTVPPPILKHMRNKLSISHHLKDFRLTIDLSDYEYTEYYVTKKRVIVPECFGGVLRRVFWGCMFVTKKIINIFAYLFCTPKVSDFPLLLTSELLLETIKRHSNVTSENINSKIQVHTSHIRAEPPPSKGEKMLYEEIQSLKQLISSLQK